jgi:hypothetical protein
MSVINPLTHRKIKINGPTYKRLVAQEPNIMFNTYTANPTAGKNKPLGKIPPLSDTLKQEKVLAAQSKRGRTWRIDKLLAETPNEKRGERRGMLTRGWAGAYPQGTAERAKVFEQCGEDCFVAKPQKNAKGKTIYGYPICRRCNAQGRCDCAIDPRGVQAAYQRAQEYGHKEIAEKAMSLKKQYKIGKTS